jgi:branched-chain amino acid transport system permease protein
VSGYLSGILAIFMINLIMAYAVFLPAAAGIINLGIAGFMAIGAYLEAYLNAATGLPMIVTVPTVVLLSGAVGFVMAFPILRTRGVYMVLATFAFAEIVSGVILNLEVVGGAAGYPVNDYLGLPVIAVAAGLVMLIVIYLLNTRFGLAIRSVHDDEPVAALFGVNVRMAKVAAFAIGAAFAGLGGALYGHHYNYIDVAYFGAAQSIYVLLYVLVGGTQTAYGPIVGAALYSLLPEVLRQSAEWRYVIFALVIIAVMALRPEGILTRPLLDRIAALARRPAA